MSHIVQDVDRLLAFFDAVCHVSALFGACVVKYRKTRAFTLKCVATFILKSIMDLVSGS